MSFLIQIVRPSSFSSLAATSSFYAEIKKALEVDAAIVLVNLECIPSLSSANFLAVVKALKLVRASGCQLFLCSLSEQVRILFELTGLDQAVKTFTNVDEFNQHINQQIQRQRFASEVPRPTKSDLPSLLVDNLKLAS